MSTSRITALLLAFTLVAGCGGSPEPEERVEIRQPERTTSGGEPEDELPPERQMQIEGLMGSLSQMEAERGLSSMEPILLRCLSQGSEAVPMLGGSIKLKFRVATSGEVAWVYPEHSTIGHRETERCILDGASGLRFPRPRGGEAELSKEWSFDALNGRPPGELDMNAFGEAGPELITLVAEACPGRQRVNVTAYIRSNATVRAAGAASADQIAPETLDCITAAVEAWQLPEGTSAGKLRFRLN